MSNKAISLVAELISSAKEYAALGIIGSHVDWLEAKSKLDSARTDLEQFITDLETRHEP